MSTPQRSPSADAVAELAALFGQVHEQLRAEVEAAPAALLGWVPGPEMNSVTTIVVHLLGSEAETLQVVAGIEGNRDRPAEFRIVAESKERLLSRLDRADALLQVTASTITFDDLVARRSLPTLPAADTRSGLEWLVTNYGHAREHLGHLTMTRQLWSTDHA
jgi:hypothetical protein